MSAWLWLVIAVAAVVSGVYLYRDVTRYCAHADWEDAVRRERAKGHDKRTT